MAAGALIKFSYVDTLRSNLASTRTNLVLVLTPPFTDPSLAAGDRIKAVHIQELRSLVK